MNVYKSNPAWSISFSYLVSKEIIVGTSVTAGLLLVGLFLLLIITGSIKIGTCRRLRVFVQQNLPQHQE